MATNGHTKPPARRPRPEGVKSQDVFFPLASIHAAVFAPLSVYAMTTGAAVLPKLVGLGHAFEMFFGFALALLAGYLLGPISKTAAWVLAFLWLAGRAAVLIPAGPYLAMILTVLFAIVLAWRVVPRFRHAKKWRNRAITWILTAIFLMPLAWLAQQHGHLLDAPRWIPATPLLLFALLMAFMGGRIIAPAAAGEVQRLGGVLEARVQPAIEGGLVILVAIAVVILAVPRLQMISVAAIIAAGVLALVRLLRWRLWMCRERADILAMGAGYAWLSAGFVAIGLSMMHLVNFTAAAHFVTVGALGTLSTSVMLQQAYLRKLKRKPTAVIVYSIVVLVAVAAVARAMSATGGVERVTGLWLAAASWSVAYFIVAMQLLRLSRR